MSQSIVSVRGVFGAVSPHSDRVDGDVHHNKVQDSD